MKAAYCKPCQVVFAVGDLPTTVKVKDRKAEAGAPLKDHPCRYTHIAADDTEHEGVLVELPFDPMQNKEKASAYFVRILKTYKDKLNA